MYDQDTKIDAQLTASAIKKLFLIKFIADRNSRCCLVTCLCESSRRWLPAVRYYKKKKPCWDYTYNGTGCTRRGWHNTRFEAAVPFPPRPRHVEIASHGSFRG